MELKCLLKKLMTLVNKSKTIFLLKVDMMKVSIQLIEQNQAIIAYLIMAAFLYFEMMLQVSLEVMTKQIIAALHIDSARLGFLSGAYFYTYAAMQIPVGLLFARFNFRYVVICALALCITGTLLLATVKYFWIGVLARTLMGMGSAFGFISVLVVISEYFQRKQFAVLVGIAQLLGAAGAVCGIAPMNSLIELVGWRLALIYLSILGVVLIFLIIFLIRKKCINRKFSSRPKLNLINSLSNILRLKQNWMIASYAFCSWIPITAFASLWGIPYLTSAYSVNTTMASLLISMVWMGVAIGSPVVGSISDAISSRSKPLMMVSLIGFISSLLIIYCHVNLIVLCMLMLLMGIGCSGQALSFSVVKDNNLQDESIAIGFNNMAVVITGGIVQPMIGYILNMRLGYSELFNFKLALFLIPTSFLICLIFSGTFIKESYILNSNKKDPKKELIKSRLAKNCSKESMTRFFKEKNCINKQGC